jgi:hypothetical protein
MIDGEIGCRAAANTGTVISLPETAPHWGGNVGVPVLLSFSLVVYL